MDSFIQRRVGCSATAIAVSWDISGATNRQADNEKTVRERKPSLLARISQSESLQYSGTVGWIVARDQTRSNSGLEPTAADIYPAQSDIQVTC